MSPRLSRRSLIGSLPALLLLNSVPMARAEGAGFTPDLGPAQPFSFEALMARAEALAGQPYKAPVVKDPALYDKIDYDAYWHIRFKPDHTVYAGPVPLQFFHEGTYFRTPVALHLVENGEAREVTYTASYFDMPEDSPARAIEGQAGFAGFRIMRPDLKSDWISFLGAAYFRTDGADRQYGLSARAVAIDTGLSTPEEFPRFTAFWIEGAADGTATIYALMDGPSVTGALRISGRDHDGQVLDIATRFYFRKEVKRLGIAPLTSMFWYSEENRLQGFDWRPEVHDSDGLAMISGTGERIWRPLNDPDRVVTSSFADDNPKGFGLIQRDRNFDHYQDDGVFYNKRPSVWIAPKGDWGKGAVQLVEIPTDDEIFDNIVAYWVPEAPVKAGDRVSLDYKQYWGREEPVDWKLARTVATRLGRGGVPGQERPKDQIKVAVDFAGPALDGLNQSSGVTPEVSAPDGVKIINPYVLPVVGTKNWRLIFDVKAAKTVETVDIRAYLSMDGKALSETWLGQLHPEQILRWGKH
ncbi:glucan biosynthesis protein [Solirhodobacter olei]|uniref:glucan biosynthesis protein n=1 Tax=Solirhodobacter olei TaxID=2493082 RepID=UPI001F4E149B|nr:glucan biosynthesis protein D [Solirhodobacter olei]